MAAKKAEKIKPSQLIWMDGQFVPWADAKIHVLTHSMHYGVAVFEGIRCYPQPDGRGAIFRLREHVRRLFESAHICLMEMPYGKEQVFEACKEVMRDNVLYTPPVAGGILEGITRESILRIAKDKGIPVEERRFSRDYLYCADEAFLCGTAAEITPVRDVDDRRIGAGEMGPITREIQSTFFRAVRGMEPRYSEWLTPLDAPAQTEANGGRALAR